MNRTPAISRREFLVATSVIGGGMALALVPRVSDAATASPTPAELTPWLTISPDDIITVRAPGPEAGTGNTTQTAMYVAEELACDWTKVRVEPISFNRNVREKDLYLGATGIWSTFAGAGASGELMTTLMQAGASARERLRAAAPFGAGDDAVSIAIHAGKPHGSRRCRRRVCGRRPGLRRNARDAYPRCH